MNEDLATRLANVPGGPISKLTKEPLLVIAEALGLKIETKGPNKSNVADIKALVKTALEAPGMSESKEFHKFIVYPRGSSTTTTKNSVDKTNEDGLQNKVASGPATGYTLPSDV